MPTRAVPCRRGPFILTAGATRCLPQRGTFRASWVLTLHAQHVERCHLVRAGDDPGQALYRHRAAGRYFPSGARSGRRPDQVPPGLRAGRRGGAVRRRGQGVRAGGRPDGRADRRGLRQAAAAHRPQHRGAELHPGRPDRSDPDEPELLRGAGESRDAGLRAAPRRAGAVRPGGRGPGRAAPAGVAGHAAHPGRRAGAGDPALAGRGARGRLPVPGRGHRDPVPGAEDGVLADRLDDRGLRSRRSTTTATARRWRNWSRPRWTAWPRRSRPSGRPPSRSACWTRSRPAWRRPGKDRTGERRASARRGSGPAPDAK